jgi:nucleotide-binding universal stress UspA family protein
MFKSILLCTDGSPAANIATDYAIWFARKLGARIHGLYVTDIGILEGPLLADISGALGAQPYSAFLPQLKQLQRDNAASLLAETAQRCRDAHVECDTAHETGSLVQALLDHGRDADLIVMGAYGHTRIRELILGSTTSHVMRKANVPALLARGS